MTGSDFSSKLAEIKAKVQKLVSLHREAYENNSRLLKENAELSEIVDKQNKLLKEMNEKIKTIQIARSVTETEPDNHRLKLKINELIREVDKCLSQLNS